jgi:HAD superfamily phosphoserine phosphatase-like hydrolase
MALALFDLDETLIAGDSASLWLEYMVAQELAPAGMVAEEQAMMSLYHQGKMDMHQYMAFTLQPLAGKSRQWLSQQCHHFAEQVLRERLYPEGLARIEWHRERGDELVLISASGEHLVAPMAQMLGMDHCVAILLDEEEGHADRPDPRHPEFSRRQGGPHQPALCRAGQPLAGELWLQRLPQRSAHAAGGEPSPCGQSGPRAAPVRL